MTEGAFTDMMAEVDDGAFDAMDPANVSPLVVWLGSSESAGVTGRMFEVEGGIIGIAEGFSHGPRRRQGRPLGSRRDRLRRRRPAARSGDPDARLRRQLTPRPALDPGRPDRLLRGPLRSTRPDTSPQLLASGRAALQPRTVVRNRPSQQSDSRRRRARPTRSSDRPPMPWPRIFAPSTRNRTVMITALCVDMKDFIGASADSDRVPPIR